MASIVVFTILTMVTFVCIERLMILLEKEDIQEQIITSQQHQERLLLHQIFQVHQIFILKMRTQFLLHLQRIVLVIQVLHLLISIQVVVTIFILVLLITIHMVNILNQRYHHYLLHLNSIFILDLLHQVVLGKPLQYNLLKQRLGLCSQLTMGNMIQVDMKIQLYTDIKIYIYLVT